MLLTEKKNKINKLLKIAILCLWACGLLLEFRPAQAESYDPNPVELNLTTFSLAISASARLQMYTLLPLSYISHQKNTDVGYTKGYQADEPAHYINNNTTSTDYSSANYTAYGLDRSYPGIGMRYSVEQQWFVYGETRMTNYRPRTSEAQLFHPDEPRSILIGGGIHF